MKNTASVTSDLYHLRAECGCEVDDSLDALTITYCPLHASAPDLLAALEALTEDDLHSLTNMARARTAIKKARA